MTRGSINRTRDVVSGAVASKRGHGAKREVFVDPHIPAKYDRFLAVHERAEAAAMSKGMSYARAHSTVAVPAERKAVERAGMDWKKYSERIAGLLSHVEHERVCKAPRGVHVDPKKAIRK